MTGRQSETSRCDQQGEGWSSPRESSRDLGSKQASVVLLRREEGDSRTLTAPRSGSDAPNSTPCSAGGLASCKSTSSSASLLWMRRGGSAQEVRAAHHRHDAPMLGSRHWLSFLERSPYLQQPLIGPQSRRTEPTSPSPSPYLTHSPRRVFDRPPGSRPADRPLQGRGQVRGRVDQHHRDREPRHGASRGGRGGGDCDPKRQVRDIRQI